MIRKRLAVATTIVGLGLSAIGVRTASADPTSLNEVCKDVAFQQTIAELYGVPANHGGCVQAGRSALAHHDCHDPVVQQDVAAFAGVQANYGQCKRALENLVGV